MLAQHPAIQQAVVLVREDADDGDKRLVAYVVTEASRPSTKELRDFLKQKLPDYMVPAVFVILGAMPLSANGKLDRTALPAPEQFRDLEHDFVAPRTPTEDILANIWVEVLKLDAVGVYDNFFELGGHSLLATQVVSRIRNALNCDLPLRTLFETPTLAGLAQSIQPGNESPSVQSWVPALRPNAIPLSFAQQRLWFLDRLDPDRATYNVPAEIRLRGELDITALEQSLNEVIRRHEGLRTVFPTIHDNPVQKILPSLVLSLTPIDLGEYRENERETALQTLL
jgi:acyl carrier protein